MRLCVRWGYHGNTTCIVVYVVSKCESDSKSSMEMLVIEIGQSSKKMDFSEDVKSVGSHHFQTDPFRGRLLLAFTCRCTKRPPSATGRSVAQQFHSASPENEDGRFAPLHSLPNSPLCPKDWGLVFVTGAIPLSHTQFRCSVDSCLKWFRFQLLIVAQFAPLKKPNTQQKL